MKLAACNTGPTDCTYSNEKQGDRIEHYKFENSASKEAYLSMAAKTLPETCLGRHNEATVLFSDPF